MQLLLVPICLAIFSSACISASDPHYVITVPAWSVQESQQKACITFVDLKGVVNVRLELQKEKQVEVVVDLKIDTPDFFQCFTFQVPALEEEEDWSVWSFHVSALGEDINEVNEVKNIIIVKGFDLCFIQTDKAEYKPGDTVKFRIMSVDLELHAAKNNIAVVALTDPNGYRIGQWLNVPVNQGIADFSFPLANELSLGTYKIILPSACEKEITVSEYVPKRFEVKINLPSNVSMTDNSFLLESCGSYTYGKPVQGTAHLMVCPSSIAAFWRQHPDYRWHPGGHVIVHKDDDEEEHSEHCLQIRNVMTDSKGCLSREIDLHFFNFSRSDRETYLKIKSSLTEEGTGHNGKASANLYLGNYRKIQFVGVKRYYFTGVPFTGKLQAIDENKQPMANEVISLSVSENYEMDLKLVTDKNGLANFTFDTSTWKQGEGLFAVFSSEDDDHNYFYSREMLWIYPFYSEGVSFLIVEKDSDQVSCDSDLSVTVKYDINKNSLGPNSDHLTFFYFLLSKGGVTSYKEHKLDIKDASRTPTLHGSFHLNLHIDAEYTPIVYVFVFSVLPNGETIANRVGNVVSECSKNKVQLSFSEDQVHPGEKVKLKVTAESGSWCSVRSVDKGFFLHKPHEEPSYVSDFLYKIAEMLYIGQQGYKKFIEDPEINPCRGDEIAVHNERFVSDAFSIFKSSNLKIFTNTQIKKPVKCASPDVSARSSKKIKDNKELKRPYTRAYFPDTWLFDLVTVGPEGHTVLNLTTPDSITKWVTDAICLGKSGLGEIKDVGLTTFQPYFIDLIVPYSVVQEEKFTIQAMVFSYDKRCMLVVASLSNSEDFTTVQSKEQTRCVCGGHSTLFTWDATVLHLKNLKIHVSSGSLQLEGVCPEDPLLLGKDHREDSIEKTIVVKARGHEEQQTETFLLYPGGNHDKIPVSYQVPERLVPGSARAHIIVLGDLIGNSIANMENILRMPDGCGEQNIAKFSRFVYSLQYLQSTKELRPKYQKKALEYLTEGFQKQLTFKRNDGSYGFFSMSKSNIWLTALVIKAFRSSKDFIYIDETHDQQAVKWLKSHQIPNGCFSGEKPHYNNDLEADNEVAQTAYVVISLLEHPQAYNGSIVEDALMCLKNGAHNETSVYTQALLAYAFTLSGDSKLRQETLKRLDEAVIKKDGSKHWETNTYHHGAMETSAYVVLALLSEKTTTQRDLEESADIIRWVVGQQSAYGGFRSSQDTTVALQALAKYAAAIHHKKGDATVTVESKSGFHKEIHVDKSNSLLLQTVDLPEFPGEYTVTVTGNGYVYVQSHLHYNSLPVNSDVYFALNVSTEPAACTHEGQTHFEVHVDIRYSGRRAVTNMAMITVEFLSGFHADEKSVNKLEKNPTVNRTEVSEDKITIYLDKLTHEAESFTFGMRQETRVKNLQPANVIVYDYYVPDEQAIAEYNSPCNAGLENDQSH